jgi:hypothetical protein
MDGAYIFGPLRHLIYTNALPKLGAQTPFVMIALDAVFVAGTGFVAGAVSRQVAKRVLHDFFAKLLPRAQLNKIKLKTGSVGFYAYAGAGALFFATVAAAMVSGHIVPEWVAYLLPKHG